MLHLLCNRQPVIKFRNYHPATEELQENKLEPIKAPEIEEVIADPEEHEDTNEVTKTRSFKKCSNSVFLARAVKYCTQKAKLGFET
jgi:hypothetical protein